jgi:hypothetical protein
VIHRTPPNCRRVFSAGYYLHLCLPCPRNTCIHQRERVRVSERETERETHAFVAAHRAQVDMVQGGSGMPQVGSSSMPEHM